MLFIIKKNIEFKKYFHLFLNDNLLLFLKILFYLKFLVDIHELIYNLKNNFFIFLFHKIQLKCTDRIAILFNVLIP